MTRSFSSLSTEMTFSPSRKTAPRSLMKCCRVSTISRSTKSRIVGLCSMIVTSTFSAVIIDAYSRPMTPAPTTIRSRGKRSSRISWSESITRDPVEEDRGAVRRPRPARDEDVLRDEPARPRRALYFESVRVEEPRGARHHLDVVALQLSADDVHFAGEHRLHPESEVRDGDLVLDRVVAPVEGALPESGEVEDPFAQRLGGDRSGVDADAADHLLAVDDRDPLAELCRRDRALLSRRAGTDHDEVVRGGEVRAVRLHAGSLASTAKASKAPG